MRSHAADEQWTVDKLSAVLELQRYTQTTSGPPNLELRKQRLDRLGATLSNHADALIRAISADYGNRPLAGALAAEIRTAHNLLAQVRTLLRAKSKLTSPVRVPCRRSADGRVACRLDDVDRVAVDLDVIGCQRLRCRQAECAAGANVEAGQVKWARYLIAVEVAVLTERPLFVRAPIGGRKEVSLVVAE
jgi:hypothetical protein